MTFLDGPYTKPRSGHHFGTSQRNLGLGSQVDGRSHLLVIIRLQRMIEVNVFNDELALVVE
jgi:hypothetical protein